MSDALARYRMAERQEKDVLSPYRGEGGPEHQRQMYLREKMRREDPAKFMSLQQRGYDPYGQEQGEIRPDVVPQAFAPSINPEVMFSPNVARAYSTTMTPEQQAAKTRAELIMLSRSSPRGAAFMANNRTADAELAKEIDRLRNSAMPADYGDGNFGWDRKLVDALLRLTGQGGGMR